MAAADNIIEDIRAAAAEQNPRERFRQVSLVEECVRGSEDFHFAESSVLLVIIDELRKFFTDKYDRVREVGAKLTALAIAGIRSDDYEAIQGATTRVLPLVGYILSGGEAIEKHEEVRVAFLHLIGALISKDAFWKQDLAERFMLALMSPIIVALSDSAPPVKEAACKFLLEAIRTDSSFTRHAGPGTMEGLKSCIASKSHPVQMLGLKVLGTLFAKGGAVFDVVQACELVCPACFSESYGVKLVYLHAAADLMSAFPKNDQVFKILLPGFIPMLRNETVQLAEEAKNHWLGIDVAWELAYDVDVEASQNRWKIMEKYKDFLVERFCKDLVGQQLNRSVRLAGIRGLRTIGMHLPEHITGVSHRLVEALTFGLGDEDSEIRLQCVLMSEVVGNLVPVKTWIAILEGVALGCLGRADAKQDLGKPIQFCSIALKGTNGEDLLEKLDEDDYLRSALDVLLGILSLTRMVGNESSAEAAGKCILTTFGYLQDIDVPSHSWNQLFKLVVKTMPLMTQNSDLMKELEFLVPHTKNIEQNFETLFRLVEHANVTSAKDSEWMMFEMLFTVCKTQAVNRYDAIMRLCTDVASREESESLLVLRCFKIVAMTVKTSAQEWSITDRRVDDFARLVKQFVEASALPALRYLPGFSSKVMQSAVVELILEIVGSGRVFSDRVESFEETMSQLLVGVVTGHDDAATKCKALEVLKRRVRFFGPPQHKLIVTVVHPGVFVALEDKVAEVRRMAMKTMVEIGRSFQYPSEVPKQERCKLLYKALEVCKLLSEDEEDKHFSDTKGTVEALSDFTVKLMHVDETTVLTLSEEYEKLVADMNRQAL